MHGTYSFFSQNISGHIQSLSLPNIDKVFIFLLKLTGQTASEPSFHPIFL
jgi:hypothetical protein